MWVINNELYHHGIQGQKWGVRRYQNEDGSLTPAGEKRYNTGKRYGRSQYWVDLKETERHDLYREKGEGNEKTGLKALKREYKEYDRDYAIKKKQYRADRKANNPNAIHPGEHKSYDKYVDDLVTNRAIKSYKDQDEAKRDYYAWLTERAVHANAAGFLVTGVYDLNQKHYATQYDYYDSVVKNKKKK